MELNQLEYFKTLASLCNFTAAAHAISISQPALSRSIRRLEEELGVPLFDRVGKSVYLTKYGETFLAFAARSLSEIENGRQAISALSAPTQGIVNLGFLPSFGTYLVPEIIRQSSSLFPKIQFTLTQNSSDSLIKMLSDGKLDLLLCSTSFENHAIRFELLCTEELYIVVPKTHRLAARGEISLAEIAAEPFIAFKPQYLLRTISEKFFAAMNIAPQINFEGDEILTVASLVAAGLGVAMIPHTVGLEHLDIVFLKVRAPKCARPIGLAWNGERFLSPVAKKIRRFISDAFQHTEKLKLEPYYRPL
jgi:DNA-binding transcriptional LysR family regulator